MFAFTLLCIRRHSTGSSSVPGSTLLSLSRSQNYVAIFDLSKTHSACHNRSFYIKITSVNTLLPPEAGVKHWNVWLWPKKKSFGSQLRFFSLYKLKPKQTDFLKSFLFSPFEDTYSGHQLNLPKRVFFEMCSCSDTRIKTTEKLCVCLEQGIHALYYGQRWWSDITQRFPVLYSHFRKLGTLGLQTKIWEVTGWKQGQNISVAHNSVSCPFFDTFSIITLFW